jgi:hypothetical protein
VIDQGLQFGPFGGEQGFAVEGCGEGLVGCAHASVLMTPGKQLDGHPLLSPPSLWRGLGYTAAPRRNCCLPGLVGCTHVSVSGPGCSGGLVDCWTAASASFVIAGRHRGWAA